jgi:hypothetical protein
MRGITADRLTVARMLAAAADALHDFMSRLQPEKAAWFLEEEETGNALALIDPLVQMLLAGPQEVAKTWDSILISAGPAN